MTLNKEWLAKAGAAYARHQGDSDLSLEVAIETYLAELFRPGELIVGEPIQPQRDYRKELWFEVYLKSANMPETSAERAVDAFDKFFAEGGAQ